MVSVLAHVRELITGVERQAGFIGAALAAHASGLTPAWQRLLGLVGWSLLRGLTRLAAC